MKRIESACICQTLHFTQKENVGHDLAVQANREETENYKRRLDRSRTQYKIIEETEQADGSIILQIIKQYNTSPIGNYLD